MHNVGPGIILILNIGFLMMDLKNPEIHPKKSVAANINRLTKPEFSLHHLIISFSAFIVL